MSNYLYVSVPNDPSAARLGPVVNMPKEYQLEEDVSLEGELPLDVHFNMMDGYGLQLRDVLNCESNALVISEAVKNFLDGREDVGNAETPRVNIVDHEGKVLDEPYYLLHLRRHQDCIDEEQTEVERWAVDPESFQFVYDLTLNESRIDPDVTLFRLKRYPYPIIIRRDLAERIDATDLTGLTFREIEEYDHFDEL
jgi:hypothetical protein